MSASLDKSLAVTESFVSHTLLRAALGRMPTMGEAAAMDGMSLASSRNAVLRSDAFLRARGQRTNVPEGIFIGTGEPGSASIGVISNCQGPELARWLTLSTGASTLGIEVMGYDPTRREQFLRPFNACDWILVAPLQSQQFHGLRAEDLEELFPRRVITIPSINFSGLQPDIVQLGSIGARLASPVGSHSRLIVSGFLQGLSVTQTLASFREDIFAAFGFFDRWGIAEVELRERERACQIKIADDVIELCRRQPVMFTENHPDSPIYLVAARKVAKLIGVSFQSPSAAALPPLHALSTAWPVYDAIAAHHELPYRTTQLYSTLDELLTLQQLVERCFTAYAATDRNMLAAAATERSIPF